MTRYEYMTQDYQRLASQQSDVRQVQQLQQQLAALQGALVSIYRLMVAFHQQLRLWQAGRLHTDAT